MSKINPRDLVGLISIILGSVGGVCIHYTDTLSAVLCKKAIMWSNFDLGFKFLTFFKLA